MRRRLLRAENKVVQQGCRLLGFGMSRLRPDQQGTERLQRHVVRRRTVNVFVAPPYHQQVPVLHARIEVYPVVAQLLLQVADEDIGLLRGDVPGGMVLEQFAFDANQIAAHGHVAGL